MSACGFLSALRLCCEHVSGEVGVAPAPDHLSWVAGSLCAWPCTGSIDPRPSPRWWGRSMSPHRSSTALDTGRINHAYLFSGPRGCGKTSSARILARSLNCEQGPTSTPCNVCDSCVSLGPGGTGNLDVTELDAASHGGVDDTRELRDKAFHAPAASRYRVFIIDEAHMVTAAGFNALLKIVEEPPEHLIFIFATTEPEKVLPTIRSAYTPLPVPPVGAVDHARTPGKDLRPGGRTGRACGGIHWSSRPAAVPLVTR